MPFCLFAAKRRHAKIRKDAMRTDEKTPREKMKRRNNAMRKTKIRNSPREKTKFQREKTKKKKKKCVAFSHLFAWRLFLFSRGVFSPRKDKMAQTGHHTSQLVPNSVSFIRYTGTLHTAWRYSDLIHSVLTRCIMNRKLLVV